MKMKCGLTLLVFIGGMLELLGQAEGGKPNIPSSPAFSILNFEPTAVMRPTSNKDLASDILNSFDEDGKLMVNLGLEVSPYWLKSRPTLTREKYLNPDIGHTFLQSLSLSGASVKDSASGNNKFGVGFRFKILNGRPVDDLSKAEAELKEEETIIAMIAAARTFVGNTIKTKEEAINFLITNLSGENFNPEAIDRLNTDANNISNDYDDTPAGVTLFLNKLITNRVDANNEPLKKVVQLTYQRKGLILELAGASGFNASDKNNLERTGIWINASNYISPTDVFTLTARTMFQNHDSSVTNFDIGIGYLKQTDKYNISIESMLRWYQASIPDFNSNNQPINRSEKDFTYRLAVQGSYIIKSDISINISFGKDFGSPFYSGTSYFSIFGLNYSLFNKERIRL